MAVKLLYNMDGYKAGSLISARITEDWAGACLTNRNIGFIPLSAVEFVEML